MPQLIISEEEKGARADVFVAEKLSEFSRSQVQKMIKNGQILINKTAVTPHYKLKAGDKITINPIPETKKKIIKTKEIKELPKIPVIDETDEYIIINKPAGIIAHGTEHITKATLVDALLPLYPELRQIGEDPDRPAIVHRLDKEVSGIMVIPRNQDSFDNIKSQFQKRTIKKEYTALVYGVIAKNDDEINFPITRSAQGYKMAAIPASVKGSTNLSGKRALTEFHIIKKYICYTLLRVLIKTGRTHQIRCHLAAYGNPVVGDNLYNTKKTREKNEKVKLGRVFLVASKLSFKNLKGELKEYEIELPKVLKNFLETIK
jgi:23S rRNA pseudouridine1911/1915/1917 synthase